MATLLSSTGQILEGYPSLRASINILMCFCTFQLWSSFSVVLCNDALRGTLLRSLTVLQILNLVLVPSICTGNSRQQTQIKPFPLASVSSGKVGIISDNYRLGFKQLNTGHIAYQCPELSLKSELRYFSSNHFSARRSYFSSTCHKQILAKQKFSANNNYLLNNAYLSICDILNQVVAAFYCLSKILFPFEIILIIHL